MVKEKRSEINKNILFLILFIFSVALFSCHNEENLEDPQATTRAGEIVLGKKLENPYSLRNMRTAYENIRSRNAGGRTKDELDIRPTHL